MVQANRKHGLQSDLSFKLIPTEVRFNSFYVPAWYLRIKGQVISEAAIRDDRKSFYPLVLPVPFLYLVHQLISGKLPSDHHDQVLNNILRTIHIQ